MESFWNKITVIFRKTVTGPYINLKSNMAAATPTLTKTLLLFQSRLVIANKNCAMYMQLTTLENIIPNFETSWCKVHSNSVLSNNISSLSSSRFKYTIFVPWANKLLFFALFFPPLRQVSRYVKWNCVLYDHLEIIEYNKC